MTIELPTLNTELLSQIIKWAELSAEKHIPYDNRNEEVLPGWGVWDQNVWFRQTSTVPEGFCGTACCLAGQAALQTGWLPASEDEGDNSLMSRGKDTEDVWEIGKDALGLTSSEADELFEGGNDLDDVKAITNGIYERRGLGIPYPDHDYNGNL